MIYSGTYLTLNTYRLQLERSKEIKAEKIIRIGKQLHLLSVGTTRNVLQAHFLLNYFIDISCQLHGYSDLSV
jgi:hypothetical protein